MAIFTGNFKNELDQLKSTFDEIIQDNLIPATKNLVHNDVKTVMVDLVNKEVLMETRAHGAYLIKQAASESNTLLRDVALTVIKSIELIRFHGKQAATTSRRITHEAIG